MGYINKIITWWFTYWNGIGTGYSITATQANRFFLFEDFDN